MRRKFYACLICLLVAAVMAPGVFTVTAQTGPFYYVRAGAAGNNSGSDWANAFAQLPANLQRGATYYVADGSYSGYILDDSVSGTSLITIKKAITQDHGTNTGWSDAYGDGQASFDRLTVRTSYWRFDGTKRDSMTSGHGFKVSTTACTSDSQLVRLENGASNVTFEHVEFAHCGTGPPSDQYRQDSIWTINSFSNQITFRKAYFHDVARVFFLVYTGKNWLIEDSYFYNRKQTNSAIHGEAMSINNTGSNAGWIIRNNVFQDTAGTGVIVIKDSVQSGYQIYGNVMFHTGTWEDGYFITNGAITNTGKDTNSSMEVYNNTFVNLNGWNSGIWWDAGSNNKTYNNLWYNCETVFHKNAGNDYNWYYPSPVGELNGQTGAGNPFVSVAAGDFRLKAATNPGLPLLSLDLDLDLDGNLRGADGIWDRGAFEFGGEPPEPDTTPPTVSIVSPASGATVSETSTIDATASDNIGISKVEFFVDGSFISMDTASPYSICWDSATVASGSHTLTAKATDTSGNSTTSGPVTITVSEASTSPNLLSNGSFGCFTNGLATGWSLSSDSSIQYSTAQDTGQTGSSQKVAITSPGSWGLFLYQKPAFKLNESYEWKLWYKTSSTNPITAEITNASASQTVLAQQLAPTGGLWKEASLTFTYDNSEADSLRIYSNSAGTFWLDEFRLTTASSVPSPPPDTTPPTVTLTSPAGGSTVSGAISIRADASDDVGVAGVQFQVNGVNQGAEDVSNDYSVSWDTGSVPDGSYTLKAVARDEAGNTAEAAVNVTVSNAVSPPPDTTPPTVSLTSPAGGSTVSGTISIKATASDDVGIEGVQFQVNGVNRGAEDLTSPYSVSWDTTTVPDGSYTLKAVARDEAGNTAQAALNVTVSNSVSPPPSEPFPSQPSLLSNGDFESFTGNVATDWTLVTDGKVGYSASQDAGHSGSAQKISITSLGTWGLFLYQKPVFELNQTYEWSFWYKTSGANSIWAEVTDSRADARLLAQELPGTNGAWKQQILTFTYTNSMADMLRIYSHTVGSFWLDDFNLGGITAVPDTTPPTITITSPADGSTLSGTITIKATASDDVGIEGVQFQVNGVNRGAEDVTSPYSVSWDTTTVTDGSYTLTAVARDEAGNTAEAAVKVTVSNSVPVPSLLSNGDFESFTGNVATDWTLVTDGKVRYSASQDAGHSGSAQKISITSLGTWGLFLYQKPVFELNQTYEWSFSYKTSGANSIWAQITNAPRSQTVFSEELAGTSGVWEQKTLTFTYTSSLADMLRIYSNAVGSFWLDDFSLREISLSQPTEGDPAESQPTEGDLSSSELTYIYPFVEQSDTGWTGIAGKTSDTAAVDFEARAATGQLVQGVAGLGPSSLQNPVSVEVSPQIAKFPQEIFGEGLLEPSVPVVASINATVAPGSAFKGFWLYGSHDESQLDGAAAIPVSTLSESIFLPQDFSSTEALFEKTVAFHADSGTIRELTYRFYSTNGAVIAETAADLPGYSGLDTFSHPKTQRGYLEVSSDTSLVGAYLTGRQAADFSVFTAQGAHQTSQTLIFAHNATGLGVWTTEILVINPDAFAQTVELSLYSDAGTQLATATRGLPAKGMLWEDTLSLFGIDDVTGYVLAETNGPGLLGWLRFQGGILQSALPAQESAEEIEFAHVAQMQLGDGRGYYHGVAVLNMTDQLIEVQAEAFLSDGQRNAVHTFTLKPWEKKAQHLNEEIFFGPDFEQAGGYLRLTVLTPGGRIASFSLFYPTSFKVISAIPGQ